MPRALHCNVQRARPAAALNMSTLHRAPAPDPLPLSTCPHCIARQHQTRCRSQHAQIASRAITSLSLRLSPEIAVHSHSEHAIRQCRGHSIATCSAPDPLPFFAGTRSPQSLRTRYTTCGNDPSYTFLTWTGERHSIAPCIAPEPLPYHI